MGSKISPVDVVRLHPDDLSKVKVSCPLDESLLAGIEWGFALHPDEVRNTPLLNLDGPVEIDWTEKDGFDDVQEAIERVTVPAASLPNAGPAEHLISLRRFINAQPEAIRSGEAWQQGTACHLRKTFG